jgi:hypothetical protein
MTMTKPDTTTVERFHMEAQAEFGQDAWPVWKPHSGGSWVQFQDHQNSLHDLATERDAALARAEQAEARERALLASNDEERKALVENASLRTRLKAAEAEVARLRDALVKQIGSVLYPEDRTGYETAQDRAARYAQERVNAIATYVGAKDDDEAVAMAYSNVLSTLRAAKSRLAEREAIARAALREGGE